MNGLVRVRRTFGEWIRYRLRIGWDDTAAIQRALDQACRTGDAAVFPSGPYRAKRLVHIGGIPINGAIAKK